MKTNKHRKTKLLKANHMTSAEYCKHNGALCPYCRSTDINAVSVYEIRYNEILQPVKCNNCGKQWIEIQGIVGYTEYNGI